MKRNLLYIFATIALITLTACSGGGDDEGSGGSNDYIRIDNNVNSITLGASEKQRKIDVYSNCNWTVTVSSDGWLKADKTNGNGNTEIWIEAEENTKTSARTATLTFKSTGVSKVLTVTQSAGTLSLTVSPNEYDFDANGASYTFTVDGNTDWKVKQKPEWCEMDKSEGKSGKTQLTVTAGENPNTTARNGQIVLEGEMSTTIKVSQQGKAFSLTVSTNAFNMEATGGDYEVTVTCNGSWRINIDNNTWCDASPKSGSANTSGEKVTITCKPNTTLEERKANVTIVAGNDAKVETITVTQLPGALAEVTAPQYDATSATELTLSASFTSMFDVTEYGFCYGTEPNPTQKVKVGENGGKSGSIQTTLTVEDGQVYYIRTYAISAAGTAYSNDIQVETKGKQPGKGDNPSPDA